MNAIRKDIIGEIDAVIQYGNHYNATDDPLARAVWKDIRDEERVHVGELMTLLAYFEPGELEFLAQGESEVKEIAEKLR